MHLPPNYAQAAIEDSKFVSYALNPMSDRGQHKARLFESALGFNLANWERLKQAILDALPFRPATLTSDTPFGRKYEVVVPITGQMDAHRRNEAQIPLPDFLRALQGVLRDIRRFSHYLVIDDHRILRSAIYTLKHNVNSADAIHVAVLLSLRDTLQRTAEGLVCLAADKRLMRVSGLKGSPSLILSRIVSPGLRL